MTKAPRNQVCRGAFKNEIVVPFSRKWIWTGKGEYRWLWLLWPTIYLLWHWGWDSKNILFFHLQHFGCVSKSESHRFQYYLIEQSRAMLSWRPGLWREMTRSWRSRTWTWLKRSNENYQCTMYTKEVSVTFSPEANLFLSSTLQRLHYQQQQQQHRHHDHDQVASKELKMYGSPWSAPAWMKSNNALNGQVILFFFNGQVIVFSIIELSDTIMDLTYVSNRVTFFQSITNNGLTIMSSEKRSLTPIYLCPCVHCRYCIYPDYHLIE